LIRSRLCDFSRATRRQRLFDGDGFGEVTRLIDVAAAAHGDVVSEELKRNDFQHRHEEFGSGRKLDDVIGGLTRQAVAGGDDGNHDAIAGFHFFNVRDAFFVQRDGVRVIVIALATEGDTAIEDAADHVLYIPPAPEELSPILEIVPLQLLAYHIAVRRGCDVDQPRNLAKSVTVE